ncbi:hypothetical protein HYU11_04605 [Candidatus Woesearchaeota archaeon]|nr:hypothetical protein [Candidatus Woesearchaeota archaeon]
MSDIIVTLRLPQGLLDEVRHASEEDHFMDVSELVRSITRKSWLAYSDPYLFEVKMLRQEISSSIREKSRKLAAGMIAEELKKIKKGIGDE